MLAFEPHPTALVASSAGLPSGAPPFRLVFCHRAPGGATGQIRTTPCRLMAVKQSVGLSLVRKGSPAITVRPPGTIRGRPSVSIIAKFPTICGIGMHSHESPWSLGLSSRAPSVNNFPERRSISAKRTDRGEDYSKSKRIGTLANRISASATFNKR